MLSQDNISILDLFRRLALRLGRTVVILIFAALAQETRAEYILNFAWAIIEGDKVAVARMLDRGEDVNAIFPDLELGGETPLTMAARQGQTEIGELLLAKGAAINKTNAGGYTPLMVAMLGGHQEFVNMLLKHGADPNIRTKRKGWTLRRFAAEQGRTEISKELAAKGADVGAKESNPVYADDQLIGACEACDIDSVRTFIAIGADVNGEHRSTGNDRPLIAASRSNCLGVVRELLRRGAKVDARNEGEAVTALIVAAETGRLEIVRELISAGANVNAEKYRLSCGISFCSYVPGGDSALIAAFRKGYPDIVKALSAAGADEKIKYNATVKSSTDASSLREASYSGDLDKVKALLVAGAGFNSPSKFETCDVWRGSTFGAIYDCGALSAASIQGHVEVVKVLLAAKPDTSIKSKALIDVSYAALIYGTRSEIAKKLAVIEKILVAAGAEMPTNSRDKAVIEDLLKFAETQTQSYEDEPSSPHEVEKTGNPNLGSSSQTERADKPRKNGPTK